MLTIFGMTSKKKSQKKTIKKEKSKKISKIDPNKIVVTNKTNLTDMFYGEEEVVLTLKKKQKIEFTNSSRYDTGYDNYEYQDYNNYENSVACYFGEIKGIIKKGHPDFCFSDGVLIETKADPHYEDGYVVFIEAKNLEAIDVKTWIEVCNVGDYINIYFNGKYLIAKHKEKDEDEDIELSPELISTIASVRNYYYEGSPSPDSEKGKREFRDFDIFFTSDSVEFGCYGSMSFKDLDNALDWCAARLWGK